MTRARRRAASAGGAVLLAAVAGGVLVVHARESDSSGAQDTAKVAKATTMMGFDLNKTMHSRRDHATPGMGTGH